MVVTEKLPPTVYVCDAVAPRAVLPSPKSHTMLLMEPEPGVLLSVNDTASGVQPEVMEGVNDGTGTSCTVMVAENVCGPPG